MCKILLSVISYTFLYFTLFCRETPLSRIYALSSVKFLGHKLRLCKKKDKYEVCDTHIHQEYILAWKVLAIFSIEYRSDDADRHNENETLTNKHKKLAYSTALKGTENLLRLSRKNNIKKFFESGAYAVGMGSSLFDKKLISAKKLEALKAHFLEIAGLVTPYTL